MSDARFGIALVGCGRLAEIGYLPALAATRNVRLVAVADPDETRRDRVAGLAADAGWGSVSRFRDAASLLETAPVDAMVLASPAAAHLEDAALGASAGVAVLVEKPPAPDARVAAELARLSPPPWVGFNRRFDPGVLAVRSSVPSEGDVELELSLSYRRRSWGAHAVRDDALLDLGPHLVDWARWLTSSEVIDVNATVLDAARVDVELILSRGRARLRAAVDRPHDERIEVRDAAGGILARHRLGGIRASLRDRLSGRSGPHAMVAALARQLDAFADAARGASVPDLGTAADGVAVMTVLDAVRADAGQGGGSVPIPRPMES